MRPLLFEHTERFEFRRELGAGGFGVVYEVFDRQAQQEVALKTLKEHSGDTLLRFKREFRALADIVHPNLVTLYELFQIRDQWCFTMELIEGRPLLDVFHGPEDDKTQADPALLQTVDSRSMDAYPGRIQTVDLERAPVTPVPALLPSQPPHSAPPGSRHCQLDTQEFRSVFQQLAQGIDALHQHGKLHRDLKPSNVLLTRDGRVVILDFGLVAELTPDQRQASIQLAGTPEYMPPEQMSMTQEPTEAGDWYSFGVMLYEALTGRFPIEGKDFLEVLQRKQSETPEQPIHWEPSTPPLYNDLCRDLLQADPAARPSGEEILGRLGIEAETQVYRAPQSFPLFGRKPELARLEAAFEQVCAGTSRAIFVHGPSGIGKSRFVRHFLQQLEERYPQVQILWAKSSKQESMPYKAIDGLIDQLTHRLRHMKRKQVKSIMPSGIHELVRLFPVLQRVSSISRMMQTQLPLPDSQELRRRAFLAFRELFSHLSRRAPMVLFLDDLQWGDEDSALLLQELMRGPHAPPLLLLGGYRTEDQPHSPLLQRLLRSHAFEVELLPLAELEADDARAYAQALLAEYVPSHTHLADAVLQEAGAHPFLLETFVRHIELLASSVGEEELQRDILQLIEEGDFTLEKAIASQLWPLAENVQLLLFYIAVAGEPLKGQHLQELLHWKYPGQATLQQLQAAHLLRTSGREGDETLEIYHHRFRDILLAIAPPERITRCHRHLAQVLEEQGDVDPARLAFHYKEGGEEEKAFRYVVAAAHQAETALAFARAAQLYAMALEFENELEPTPLALQRRLAHSLANAGQSVRAAELFATVAEGFSGRERLELQRLAASHLLRSGHIDEGLEIFASILHSMGMQLAQTPLRAFFSLFWGRLKLRLRGFGRDSEPLLLSHQRPEEAEPARREEKLLLLDTVRSVTMPLGLVDPIKGVALQAQHLLLALDLDDPHRLTMALAVEAAYRSHLGRRKTAQSDALLRITLSRAKQLNYPLGIGSAYLSAGLIAFTQGRWKRSLQHCQDAEIILREQCQGAFWERANAQIYTLNARIFLGDYADIHERLPVLLEEAEARGDLYAWTFLSAGVLSRMRLALDDAPGARKAIEQALANWSAQGFLLQHYIELLLSSEIDLYVGDPQKAWDRLHQEWHRLKRSLLLRNQFNRIEILHLRGRIALALAAHSEPHKAAFSAMLSIAEHSVEGLHKARSPWATCLAQLIEAGIATLTSTTAHAIHLLAEAETGFEFVDMGLHANICRLRRAQLTPDATYLRKRALQWMESQYIHNPDAMLQTLAPGLWRPHS